MSASFFAMVMAAILFIILPFHAPVFQVEFSISHAGSAGNSGSSRPGVQRPMIGVPLVVFNCSLCYTLLYTLSVFMFFE